MTVTYPPEFLPKADGPADVYVTLSDGSLRLVWCSDPIDRINHLERALRRIAKKDYDIPEHMEGDAAAEIAERALQNLDNE
jgi:hypothetical protein